MPQWVSWRASDKAPLVIGTQEAASTTNATTWRPYTKLRPKENRGLVISDPYCGVDLDSCRDVETGELDNWAARLVAYLDSYCEVSPSGTGVHVWVRARLAADAPHKVGQKDKASGVIEQYDSGRYFTVTGQRRGKRKRIHDRQEQIDNLNIIAKVWRAGGKALWRHESQNADASGNDYALAAKVIEQGVTDPGRIERIMRLSCLERDKWDKARNDESYLRRTIRKAIEGAGKPTPLRVVESAPAVVARVVWSAEVESKDVVWRWPDWLPQGMFVLLQGDPDIGKSHLALAIATALSLGLPLPGDDREREYPQMKTLIFSAEDSREYTLKPRLERMGADHSQIAYAVSASDERHHFSLTQDLAIIEGLIISHGFKLLIFDPLNGYLEGTDGHRDIDVRTALAPLAELADRHGVIVLGLRHMSKNGANRSIAAGAGSMAYTAQARSEMQAGIDPENAARRVLASNKNNLGPKPKSVGYEIDAEGYFHWLGKSDVTAADLNRHDNQGGGGGPLKEAKEFLAEVLANGPVDSKELVKDAAAQGISKRTLARARKALNVVSKHDGEAGKRGGGRSVLSLPSEDLLPNFRVEGNVAKWER